MELEGRLAARLDRIRPCSIRVRGVRQQKRQPFLVSFGFLDVWAETGVGCGVDLAGGGHDRVSASFNLFGAWCTLFLLYA